METVFEFATNRYRIYEYNHLDKKKCMKKLLIKLISFNRSKEGNHDIVDIAGISWMRLAQGHVVCQRETRPRIE